MAGNSALYNQWVVDLHTTGTNVAASKPILVTNAIPTVTYQRRGVIAVVFAVIVCGGSGCH